MKRDEEGADDDWTDGSGGLAALGQLRTDVLSEDLRLFYLLWLTTMQDELIPEDEIEPLPGIAPLTGALEAFADFFGLDPHLVEAAAELGADHTAVSKDELLKALAAIPEPQKVELLLLVVGGDSYARHELRTKLIRTKPTPATQRA